MSELDKTIRDDLDSLIKTYWRAVKETDDLKAIILDYCAQMKPNEIITAGVYRKPTKILDREKAVLIATKYDIEIPKVVKEEVNWKLLENRIVNTGVWNQNMDKEDWEQLFKDKAASIAKPRREKA